MIKDRENLMQLLSPPGLPTCHKEKADICIVAKMYHAVSHRSSRSTLTHPSWPFSCGTPGQSSLFKLRRSFFLSEVAPVAFRLLSSRTLIYFSSTTAVFFHSSLYMPARKIEYVIARCCILAFIVYINRICYKIFIISSSVVLRPCPFSYTAIILLCSKPILCGGTQSG